MIERMGKRRRRSRLGWVWVAGASAAAVAAAGVGIGAAVSSAVESRGPDPAQIAREQERIKAEGDAYRAAEEKRLQDEANARLVQIDFPDDRPLGVLFVGDSVTAGSYASADEKVWHRLVGRDLEEHGDVDFKVNAESGNTSADALEAGIEPADVTFVLLGQNDFFKTEEVEFEANYTALLAEIREVSPDGQLACLSPWFNKSYSPESYEIVQDACREAGGRFIDLDITFSDENRKQIGEITASGRPAQDDGHPNDLGHAAIATEVIQDLFYVPAG